ncbi:fluoride efflux transporter CrcB [Seohaeicola saemankumensis]|jgi:fluoride exporter|uniref:fluoride efflux transporter CrcB n=1 Tax=Seohaeicola TaxID=481178 RepID=UPI0007F4103A|nr:fluoride efflux transporter CrcB [Paracoccaceae bacterium]MDP5334354.1 fluoride efflux transporter CrcB [Paracoccaceae bacterium]MDP5348909.1 fluoride efflux transporter CrcB [Paracoccaceae bacterium]MDP5365099.1 fluoride efflux transporter CrcB [Paracoccaceae bacterium]OAN71604.1 protein CrcB [Rhodobacteraceae bacterium EhC02]
MLTTLLQVALGGAIGATARYLTSMGALRLLGAGFPWGTLAVNVIGSFLMGLLVVVLAQRDATRLAPFLLTGVLGGFTTFSAFSLDAMALYERGETMLAAFYVGASVILSLSALVLAMVVAREVLQ